MFTQVIFFIILLAVHFFFVNRASMQALAKKSTQTKSNFYIIAALATLCFLLIALILLIMQYKTQLVLLLAAVGATITANIIPTENISIFSQQLTTMLLIIVSAFYYTVQFSRVELTRFIVYSMCVYSSGVVLVLTNNILVMFIAYELILLPTALMLDYFSKTIRSREATRFMLVWTQCGAILLFFTLSFFFKGLSVSEPYMFDITSSRFSLNVLSIIIFFGFGTKMPVWPFYWWLPEAHVEVSTNFSIVLSGVSIKFAFLCYIKFIEYFGAADIYWILVVFCLIGLFDAALKIDTESDIKKIVAYQTVVEMHALITFIILDVEAFFDISLFMFASHCWISTINFIIVDLIAKRYHTRNIEQLYGIVAESPRIIKFIFLVVFIFSSIPGTLVYSLEFYIQIQGSTSTFNLVLFVFIQLFIVVWSKNIWWTLWGGDAIHHKYAQPFTMTKSEFIFIIILLLQTIPSISVCGLLS